MAQGWIWGRVEPPMHLQGAMSTPWLGMTWVAMGMTWVAMALLRRLVAMGLATTRKVIAGPLTMGLAGLHGNGFGPQMALAQV